MSHGGNYEVAPPDLLDPNFKGNYPDGPPPIPPPPIPPIPPDPPVINEPLFKRGSDGNYDVSWATYWTKPLIREAMTFLEQYIELAPDNPYPVTCSKYHEQEELESAPGAAASCSVASTVTDNVYLNTVSYELSVYLKWQNQFTQDEWVAIFIHELIHGLGFNQYGFLGPLPGYIGEQPMTNADLALRSPRFEDAVLGYQRQVPNGTAVPLANLGHILGPGQSYDGNPGVLSIMNPSTQELIANDNVMDSILTGYFKKYGYVIKRTAPKTVKTYSLPKGFVCGNQ